MDRVVSLAATVNAQDGSLPAGTVTFESNGVQIGSAPLNNQGQAVLTYNALPAGTDNLVAMYGGSSTLAPSTSNTVMQVVNRDATHTTVASSPNPSTSGEQVTITASITPAGPADRHGGLHFEWRRHLRLHSRHAEFRHRAVRDLIPRGWDRCHRRRLIPATVTTRPAMARTCRS